MVILGHLGWLSSDTVGCLYSLDWTTGLTLELTFELFFLLSIINIAVLLLAKLNLGVLGK